MSPLGSLHHIYWTKKKKKKGGWGEALNKGHLNFTESFPLSRA